MTDENLTPDTKEQIPAATVDDSADAPIDSAEDLQAKANRAAIIASGNFHLGALYQEKVNNTHAKVANEVAAMMSKIDRIENWTMGEIKDLWDKMENKIND